MNGKFNYTTLMAVIGCIGGVIGCIGGVIGTRVAVKTYSYVEAKDRDEMIEKTKIVTCQIFQIIQFRQSSNTREEFRDIFNRQFEEVKIIDQKGIDGELLNYLIKVRGFLKSSVGVLNSDGMKQQELYKMEKDMQIEYHDLLKEFDKLKEVLSIKYNIFFDC